MLADFLSAAVQHHQAGRLDQAERGYRKVLARHPRNADAAHLLGLVAHSTGRHDRAIAMIGKAIKSNPTIADYHVSLSRVFVSDGRLSDAVHSLREAVRIRPEPIALTELGAVLRETGELEEALWRLQQAVTMDPRHADAYCHAGVTLMHLRRGAEAITALRRAVAINPKVAAYHYNLGTALNEQRQHEAGLACLRAALDLDPQMAAAHCNAGTALAASGRPHEAIDHYQAAIRINGNDASYHHYLGLTWRQLQRPEEGIACCRRAIELQPDHADAHLSVAMARLSMGDMPGAWEGLEWRWQTLLLSGIRPTMPLWNGEAAEGRTLLVLAEQGFGDTLQLCRYVPLARQRGFRIVMMAPPPLVRLLSQSFPGVDVLPFAEAVGDLYCPVMSFPRAFGTTLETIPAAGPYLRADPVQAEAWRSRLAAVGGLKVGVCWAGNPRRDIPSVANTDRRRSMAPELLAGLMRTRGCSFFSLQKTPPFAPAGFPLIDLMGQMRDFADTAALIASLDLVISVDTAIAHLAAGMGKPVWMMDRFDACWRWMLNRTDSPWYPSLRIYRQPAPGDWGTVLFEVIRDLQLQGVHR